jgi:hypothetical protein
MRTLRNNERALSEPDRKYLARLVATRRPQGFSLFAAFNLTICHMNKLTGFRLHAALFGSVLLLTAGAQIGFRERYAHERDRLAHSAAGVRSREIEAGWKTLPYTNTTQAGVVDAFVAKIDWAGLNLSEFHKSKVQSRLGQVLSYLVAPSSEEYFRLKTEGLHYRFKASRSAKMILAGIGRQAEGPFLAKSLTLLEPPSQAEADALGISRAIWGKVYGSGDRLAVSKLTGICLERLSVATTSTNSPTALLKGSVRKGWTTATEAINPGFEYPALIDRPTESGNKSSFFQLSFFAQTNDGEKAGPV